MLTVYSKSKCPNCDAVKRLLTQHALPFEVVDLDNEEARREFLAQCGPAVRQLPQVFHGAERLGGLAGVQSALPILLNLAS